MLNVANRIVVVAIHRHAGILQVASELTFIIARGGSISEVSDSQTWLGKRSCSAL